MHAAPRHLARLPCSSAQRASRSPGFFLPASSSDPLPIKQVDEGSLGEAGKNWPRPPAPQLNPATDKLGG